MPQLVLPTVIVEASYREAQAEPGARIAATEEVMADFPAYCRFLIEAAHEDTPRDASLVPWTTWWYVEGSTYLGRISVRHSLNRMLLEIGGHIGYDVRPSARRQGHATAMLRQVLPYVHSLGIDPALVTCDADNVGSRKVIEAAAGVLEDVRDGKRRYWVPTSSRPDLRRPEGVTSGT